LFYYLLIYYPFTLSRAASLTSYNIINKITSYLIYLACSANFTSYLATYLLFYFSLQVSHSVLPILKLTPYPITHIKTHILFYFLYHSLIHVCYCLKLILLTQLLVIITIRIVLFFYYWLSNILSTLLSL
jgi:hypothetical protein